jgi:hypothetical protein
MAVFPQLRSGAVAQYGFAREQRWRTMADRMAGGASIVRPDAQSGRMEWILRYRGLSQAEWAAIEALFTESEGRLKSFTFLDPAANLLAWSEDQTQAVWQKDALVQVGPAGAGPGGRSAFRIENAAQTAGGVRQDVAGPGNFFYSLSLWVKSDAGGVLTLGRSAGAASASEVVALSPEWRRVSASGELSDGSAPVTFSAVLPAGGQAEVCGLQAEAQPVAGPYRKTKARAGVYAEARFGQDGIEAVIEGPDEIGATVRVVSRVGG